MIDTKRVMWYNINTDTKCDIMNTIFDKKRDITILSFILKNVIFNLEIQLN